MPKGSQKPFAKCNHGGIEGALHSENSVKTQRTWKEGAVGRRNWGLIIMGLMERM